MEPKGLKQEMETARQRLNHLEKRYGLRHSRVLKQSMVLDELINEYNQTYYSKRRESITNLICNVSS
ncbi:aspartyl-phosphate phosphatase Spo0E family protein [Paenibacillus wynnii]|uniref:aspartyl-phosphate phosphatase Spo0E family protein n=1 Tax=Paenibacillus wynnii TaxID=268407 RepID=UPI00056AFB47|nr:aspartyl-phosphate phosphatase Spo0E family protein [Paenibacillus wynnii]